MGFKPDRKVFHLTFQDSELEGLEVMARSVSTGKLLEMQEKMDSFKEMGQTKVGLAQFSQLVDMFVPVLVSWNLEDDNDMPVPTTREGLLGEDPSVVMQIILAWAQAVAGIDIPLVEGSTGGGISPELSLPMEPLSQNRAS